MLPLTRALLAYHQLRAAASAAATTSKRQAAPTPESAIVSASSSPTNDDDHDLDHDLERGRDGGDEDDEVAPRKVTWADAGDSELTTLRWFRQCEPAGELIANRVRPLPCACAVTDSVDDLPFLVGSLGPMVDQQTWVPLGFGEDDFDDDDDATDGDIEADVARAVAAAAAATASGAAADSGADWDGVDFDADKYYSVDRNGCYVGVRRRPYDYLADRPEPEDLETVEDKFALVDAWMEEAGGPIDTAPLAAAAEPETEPEEEEEEDDDDDERAPEPEPQPEPEPEPEPVPEDIAAHWALAQAWATTAG